MPHHSLPVGRRRGRRGLDPRAGALPAGIMAIDSEGGITGPWLSAGIGQTSVPVAAVDVMSAEISVTAGAGSPPS